MKDIKPCPFCGKHNPHSYGGKKGFEDYYGQIDDESRTQKWYHWWWQISCSRKTCPACVYITTEISCSNSRTGNARRDAIAAWNRRTP